MIEQLKELFDYTIELQKLGYSIYTIDNDEYGNYFVEFSNTSVSRGYAFGGIFYAIALDKLNGKIIGVEKRIPDGLKTEYEILDCDCDNLKSAFDVIKNDIQEEDKKREDLERKAVIAKLNPRERELLGVSL